MSSEIPTEIEAKFLAVDHGALRGKLREIGAVQLQPVRLMRRKAYDFPDGSLDKIGGWVRVRDEGDKVTMSYKQLNDRTVHGTKDITLVVSSFDTAHAFLTALGLRMNGYYETKRESWSLGNVQIELDEWPWIKPFVELEGPNEAAVRTVAQQLGLDWNNAVFGSVEIAYQGEYDVTEAEVNSWDKSTFTPVPDWLDGKRKKIV